MDTCPILVVHLVKLVNEADTFVSKDESTALKRPFSSDWILVHTSRETDCACTFAGRVDHTMVDFFDVLEELTLGSARVSQQKHVDVTSDPVLTINILWLAAKHSECEALFNEVVAVD